MNHTILTIQSISKKQTILLLNPTNQTTTGFGAINAKPFWTSSQKNKQILRLLEIFASCIMTLVISFETSGMLSPEALHERNLILDLVKLRLFLVENYYFFLNPP